MIKRQKEEYEHGREACFFAFAAAFSPIKGLAFQFAVDIAVGAVGPGAQLLPPPLGVFGPVAVIPYGFAVFKGKYMGGDPV
jgi:hypothetical protein